MPQSKKELVLAALNNKPVDRVPVGFWFHFTDFNEHQKGLEDPEVIKKNLAGHKKFYESFHPDFMKIMTDGFFGYPNDALKGVRSIRDVKGIKPLGERHPWITKQVEFAKTLHDAYGKEVMMFYNVFSPVRYFMFLQEGNAYSLAAQLISEDKDAFKGLLDVIAQDLSLLSRKVITEAGVDGIYFCVQSVQDARVTKEVYEDVIAPSEFAVLNAANAHSDNNILHVCGYEGALNDLTWFKDYPAKAVNWAVNVEGVSLAEGKRLFGDKAVIGGFDNTKNGYLYGGTRSMVESFTEGLISGAGKRGVILGADCTLPNDVSMLGLEWVRKMAASL